MLSGDESGAGQLCKNTKVSVQGDWEHANAANASQLVNMVPQAGDSSKLHCRSLNKQANK
jgi:hypothetical protein